MVVTREAANLSRLQLVQSGPQLNPNLTDAECPHVWSLCALPDGVLLLACGEVGLRAVSLNRTQLLAHEPTTIRNVYRVAYDVHTDKLFLIVEDLNLKHFQLATLRRNTSNVNKWIEEKRISTDIFKSDRPIVAVCKSRILLAKEGVINTLYLFNVSAEQTLSAEDSVNVTSEMGDSYIYRLACVRRDDDKLVAFSHWDSVSLYRLIRKSLQLKLEKIDRVELSAPVELVFRGDLLLVKHRDRTFNISSFRASGSGLTEERVLLAAVVDVDAWTLAGDKLVLWNQYTKNLLAYVFEYSNEQ